jgi:DNA-binding transcriptional LysR family regulator
LKLAIKIEMLRCFAAVARSGNLAGAADRLGRTPSAVSMMLKQFEDHLGAPLFESERKSKLTALGAFAFDEARRELDHFERSIAAIENFARSNAGFVRIAAVPSVAEAILPQVVQGFLSAHPAVRVDIRDMDSAAVLREIERERVDLGLATSTGTGADIDSEPLFSDAFGVVCRSDHPLAASDLPLDWNELAPWPFIGNALCATISDERFQRILARSQLTVRNTTSLLAMVRAEVGVTVLPRLVLEGAARGLSFLPLADPAARRRIDILRRKATSLSPAAQSFQDAIRPVAQALAKAW